MGKSKVIPFIDLENESWRKIKDYSDFYEVSNLGRIRSLYDCDRGGLKKLEFPRLRKLKTGRDGRIRVRLGFSGQKDKMWLVHVLVAQAFLSDKKDGLQINHKDGNPANNNSENLEWVTASENVLHGERTGLFKFRARGSRIGISKLTDENVLYIINSKEKDSKLANMFNVSQHAIFSVKTGRTWNHVTNLPLTRQNKNTLIAK